MAGPDCPHWILSIKIMCNSMYLDQSVNFFVVLWDCIIEDNFWTRWRGEKKLICCPYIYMCVCDHDLLATFSDQITIRSRPWEYDLDLDEDHEIWSRSWSFDHSITHFNALQSLETHSNSNLSSDWSSSSPPHAVGRPTFCLVDLQHPWAQRSLNPSLSWWSFNWQGTQTQLLHPLLYLKEWKKNQKVFDVFWSKLEREIS